MKNNTLFHCFLSNLEKDTARKEFMEEQLSRLSIICESSPAVYGKLLDDDELRTIYDEKLSSKINKVPMNRGEIGCAATHMKFYRQICREGIDYTLVLEDDVLLDERFKKAVEREIEKNKASHSWDYLSFDYHAYGVSFLKLWLPGVIEIFKNKKGFSVKFLFLLKTLCKGMFLIPLTLLEELQKNIFNGSAISPLWPTHFTGAYLVTQEGAAKLLSVHDRILYTSDRLPNVARKEKGLLFKIYTPLLAQQKTEIFASNISVK